ncbi:hypothetical protein [Marinilabilia salmonicolor]|uniref:hypothetical protein n=1 Tax=Marinilabilia salmonicolor TaxID=989 RepID=UPI000AB0D737|nr:hypothetical protein [Marinilabilia salmonicolor]
MPEKKKFTKDVLKIKEPEVLVDSICNKLREDIFHRFRRRGAVVGISGGIDSSVTLAIAVRAFGAEKVLGVLLPEHDSSLTVKILHWNSRILLIRLLLKKISAKH